MHSVARTGLRLGLGRFVRWAVRSDALGRFTSRLRDRAKESVLLHTKPRERVTGNGVAIHGQCEEEVSAIDPVFVATCGSGTGATKRIRDFLCEGWRSAAHLVGRTALRSRGADALLLAGRVVGRRAVMRLPLGASLSMMRPCRGPSSPCHG